MWREMVVLDDTGVRGVVNMYFSFLSRFFLRALNTIVTISTVPSDSISFVVIRVPSVFFVVFRCFSLFFVVFRIIIPF